LVEKPEGKRPLGTPRSRWEDNIKMDLQEVGWEAWTALAHNRDRWRAVVNGVKNLLVP
jgi:hypothetical protein